MNKVRTCKVSDVSLGVYDGPHATPPPCDSGAIFLGIRNITEDGQLKLDNPRYISEEDLPKWTKRVTPHGGDIVFSYEATLNLYAIIPEGFRGCLGRRMGLIRPNPEEINGRFLYYYFFSPQWRKLIAQKTVVGSTVNRIPIETFPDFKLLLPSKPTQSRIAAVLSALDEKIAHNNELIKMLEEQAQKVYDYWFVQFDFPDENGRPYRSSGGKMVWNEQLKREIPEGWDAVTLNNICKMYQPQTLSLADLDDNADYFVYGANGIIGKYKEYNHSESEVAIACRGNSCGTVNRTLPNSWITGNAMVLQMLDRDVSNEFILRSIPHIGIYRAISGSGQPQITRENLQKLKIAYPKNNGVLLEYTKIAVHIVHRLLLLSKENMHLTAQRDFLLPLLMSGQVKVAE